MFLFFWLLYSLHIFYDTAFDGDLLGTDPSNYYLFGLVLSFLCAIPFFNKLDINQNRLGNYFLFFTSIICFLGLLNTMNSADLFKYRVGSNERLNPITFSNIAALQMSISLLQTTKVKKRWLHILYLLLFILGAVCLLVSGSKSPTVFFAVFFLIFLYKSFIKKPISFSLRFAFVLCLIIYFFIVYDLFFVFDLLVARFAGFEGGNIDEGSGGRVSIYTEAIQQFIDSPIWGSFIEVKATKQYPHNILLEAFMVLGIPGGALFCLLYFSFFIRTVYLLIKRLDLLSIIAFNGLVLSLFSGSLAFGSEFWYGYALIAATYRNSSFFTRKLTAITEIAS